jgi:hypothetical protein
MGDAGAVVGGLFAAIVILAVIIYFLIKIREADTERSQFIKDSSVPLVPAGVQLDGPAKQKLYTTQAAPQQAAPRRQKQKLYTTPPTAPTLGVAAEEVDEEGNALRDSIDDREAMLHSSSLGDPSDVEFGEKLAQGGAAAVYKGTYQFAPVAIKKLLKGQGKQNQEEKEIKLMQDEAYLMSKLRHPNIGKSQLRSSHFFLLRYSHRTAVNLVLLQSNFTAC